MRSRGFLAIYLATNSNELAVGYALNRAGLRYGLSNFQRASRRKWQSPLERLYMCKWRAGGDDSGVQGSRCRLQASPALGPPGVALGDSVLRGPCCRQDGRDGPTEFGRNSSDEFGTQRALRSLGSIDEAKYGFVKAQPNSLDRQFLDDV